MSDISLIVATSGIRVVFNTTSVEAFDRAQQSARDLNRNSVSVAMPGALLSISSGIDVGVRRSDPMLIPVNINTNTDMSKANGHCYAIKR